MDHLQVLEGQPTEEQFGQLPTLRHQRFSSLHISHYLLRFNLNLLLHLHAVWRALRDELHLLAQRLDLLVDLGDLLDQGRYKELVDLQLIFGFVSKQVVNDVGQYLVALQ